MKPPRPDREKWEPGDIIRLRYNGAVLYRRPADVTWPGGWMCLRPGPAWYIGASITDKFVDTIGEPELLMNINDIGVTP